MKQPTNIDELEIDFTKELVRIGGKVEVAEMLDKNKVKQMAIRRCMKLRKKLKCHYCKTDLKYVDGELACPKCDEVADEMLMEFGEYSGLMGIFNLKGSELK